VFGVLGRGGMGVVYKARHVRLKRIVALKMLLAGASSKANDRSRFWAEAEAVADLQHPNIVQIYEVGEHKGCPFCVLELVDGPDLADVLKDRPLPPSTAAQLVRTLALAVQQAHERGFAFPSASFNESWENPPSAPFSALAPVGAVSRGPQPIATRRPSPPTLASHLPGFIRSSS
jgi:serine/threonine protein kinase